MARVANRRIRLGRGQVTSADVTIWEARRLFLRAVFRVSPETYWSLFPDGPGDAAVAEWRARWNDDLPAMVARWQEYWNLTDQWCADVAVNTLRSRLGAHTRGCTALWNRDRFVIPKPHPGASGGILALPIADLYWNPEIETHKEARARLHALIDAELDRLENVAIPLTRPKSPDHFVWLARNQVVRESKELIADTTGRDRSQVGRAVSELAGLIGLKEREPKRGRPRRRTANTVRIRRQQPDRRRARAGSRGLLGYRGGWLDLYLPPQPEREMARRPAGNRR